MTQLQTYMHSIMCNTVVEMKCSTTKTIKLSLVEGNFTLLQLLNLDKINYD